MQYVLGKVLQCSWIGKEPLENGMNILGATLIHQELM